MNKKVAFTLAEVLITLGIIGIVSAMTIPTLIKNYQEKTWSVSAKVFEQKLTEVLRKMNTQQVLAGHNTTENFVAELSKYIKIVKICSNNELKKCIGDDMSWGFNLDTQNYEKVLISQLTTSNDFGQPKWNTNLVGVKFIDGVSAVIAYNPNCKENPYSNQVAVQDCLAILYDTSGKAKPNKYGKDLRANKNIKKVANSCGLKVGTTCYSFPFYSEPGTLNECLKKQDEYNITRCTHDSNYWFGAVDACGGVGNMPTESQLSALKQRLHAGGSFNVKLAIEAGFDIQSYYFRIWSDREVIWNNQDRVFIWDYDPKNSRYYNTFKNLNAVQSLCVIK